MGKTDNDISLLNIQSAEDEKSGSGTSAKDGPRILKQIIQIACFLVLCMIIWRFVSYMLVSKDGTAYATKTFDSIPENTVDVLFIGASTVWDGISPLTLWQENGITSYTFAASNCPPQTQYLALKEALSKQHPKVVFISPQFLSIKQNPSQIQLRTFQSMVNRKFTFNKLETAAHTARDVSVGTGIKALMPLLAYHDNWKSVQEVTFVHESDGGNMGQRCWYFYHSQFTDTLDEMIGRSGFRTGHPYKYNKITVKYYRKMINLCKANDIQVVLITMPLHRDFVNHTAIHDFSEEEGIKYINFNEPQYLKAIDIDNRIEWRDEYHLNFWGSVKFPKWLGALIDEEFDLPDRRTASDPSWEVWREHYSQFYNRFSGLMPGDLTPPSEVVSEV